MDILIEWNYVYVKKRNIGVKEEMEKKWWVVQGWTANQKAKSTSGVKAIECDVQGGRSPNPLTSSTFQSIETKALPKGSACVFWWSISMAYLGARRQKKRRGEGE